jgi:hypothetical protein
MAQLSEEEYKALAGRAATALGRLPNVHAVGIGGRLKKDQPTGELVVKVYVTTKLAPQQLSPADTVPKTFEGIPTDVVQLPIPVHEPDGALPSVQADHDRYRPLRGGVRLCAGNRTSGGTLGFLVTTPGTSGPRVFAVTNFHVIFDVGHPVTPTPGLAVGQPSTSSSLSGCCAGTFGKFSLGHFDADVDAALVELNAGTEWLAEIEEIGVVAGTHPITAAEAATGTYALRKRGETTRLTGGVVDSINVHDTTGSRTFTNGILVRPNPSSTQPTAFVRWSNFGDSGSGYVNASNEVVGIHFMGVHDPSDPHNGWGTGFPIADFISKFQTADSLTLTVATATATGQVQKVQGAVAIESRVPTLDPRLETDLAASGSGRRLSQAWLEHGDEALHIINANRRAAVLWRRHNGPAILNALIRAHARRDSRVPAEIQGRETHAMVDDLLGIFEKYGSAELRASMPELRALLPDLGGRSYGEIVGSLRP